MFCSTLTGSALATGIAAPVTFFAMGEQTDQTSSDRRVATGTEVGHLQAIGAKRFCSAATLADFTSGMA